MSSLRVAVVTCTLSFASIAHAEPRATVSIEPLYLVATMVDTTIEIRPTPHLGLAAIAGIGFPVLGATMYDVGGEANAYLQRPFSGLHLGVELRYLWGSTHWSWVGGPDTPSSSERIVGTYLGYKWIGPHGLSAVVQYGVGRMETSGGTMDVPKSQVIPIANLTAGWSF